ncbi:hypothetical protein [Natronococcus pandeyae]|nr:hypothetical protein [Natronococcus pandeyae]
MVRDRLIVTAQWDRADTFIVRESYSRERGDDRVERVEVSDDDGCE